jgi:hypothetical protein
MKRLLILTATCLCLLGMNQKDNGKHEYVKVAAFTLDQTISAEIRSYPDLQLRKLSSVEITLNANPGHDLKDVSIVGFDAQMPDHRHGMVVTPSKPKKLDPASSKKASYLIEGVKLHMPGKWVLQIKLSSKEGERLHEIPLDVKL